MLTSWVSRTVGHWLIIIVLYCNMLQNVVWNILNNLPFATGPLVLLPVSTILSKSTGPTISATPTNCPLVFTWEVHQTPKTGVDLSMIQNLASLSRFKRVLGVHFNTSWTWSVIFQLTRFLFIYLFFYTDAFHITWLRST